MPQKSKKRLIGRPARLPIETPDPDALPSPKALRLGESADSDGLPSNLFDGAGRDQRVRLYREDDLTKRMIFHGALAVDEATEEKVAELFGGGKFRAQLMVRNPDGIEVVQRSQDFRMPGPYIPVTGRLPGIGPAPSTVVPASVPVSASGLTAGISINEALDQVRLQQVLDIVKRGQEVAAPSAVPWDKIFDIGLRLVETFTTARRSSETDMGQQLERIREEMRRPQPGPVSAGIGDAVKAIRELIDVRDVITGAGNDGEGNEKNMMWRVAEKALEALTTAQRGSGPAAPPSRIPGKTDVSQLSPLPQSSTVPLWQQMLAHYRPQLLETIQRGVPAEFAADIAMQYMDPNVQGVVKEFVQRPDAPALAATVIPELQEFAVWNAKFWAAIREAMVEGEEEEGGEPPVQG